MCGIAGFVGRGARRDVEVMTAALTHRGPDANGFFEHERCHLGHRRLSIIDLGGGAQPMSTPDGDLVVVFNGEIYNHAELRAQLQSRGHVFASDHSDTEVLLHGWREWGAEMVPRLSGMWAFALLETRSGRLFLSRDRFGKKPLYYFHRNGTFAFASELTALRQHPDAPGELSLMARAKFLAYALIPAPHTPYSGIWKLPAGHNLFVEPNAAACRVSRYWRFTIEPDEDMAARGEDELASELRSVLTRATARRLVADVPVGIFLSGGIDSSAIAALAAGASSAGAIRTFTVGFREPTFDESGYARAMAEYLGTSHSEERLDLQTALEVVPEILDHLDEPQGDASLVPTWLLCRFARKQVTVALGGDGGDELFAGYDPFRALRAATFYSRLVPAPVHEAIRLLAARLPVSHANISLDFKIKRTLRGLSHPPHAWNPVWLGALEPAEIERFLGVRMPAEELFSEAIDAWEACGTNDPVDRTLQFFTDIYLQDGILAKADRASMLNSLEVRSPFLDIDVADFARHLPHRFKFHRGRTKCLLKHALRGLIPDSVIDRKKKGFGMPVGAWLRDGGLSPETGDPFVHGKFQTHAAGRSDERLFLWCEFVWQRWLQRSRAA